LAVNLSCFLIELSSLEETLALFDDLQARPEPGITEIVPAARTLLVYFQPSATTLHQLARRIARRDIRRGTMREGQQVTIPVHYNGEDLEDVATILEVTPEALIERHQASLWQVAFTGFAPGFAYMVPEEGTWNIPRRSSPRTRIPAGSVALAGEFSGIYPQASPGGWQLIGQTELQMWDLQRAQPALLIPGTRVQFVDARQQKITSLPAKPATLAEPSDQQATVTVLATGLQTLWQDNGRGGKADMGLSASGAMDKAAFHAANRIVGNPRHTPCLEITLGGFRARAHRDVVLSVTGARCPLTLRTASGETYRLRDYQPINLSAGDEILFGAPSRGLRSYLAFRGVCVVEKSLGSASRDTLAQVGPPALRPGDGIQLGVYPSQQAVLVDETPAGVLPAPGETLTLDVVLGPRTDWFSEQAVALLTDQAWQVTPQSNRIGLRLSGPTALTRSRHDELPSEGTCCGAIQVPASGQPVLFLRDSPLTGGYPVIGVVADYHLDLAGQIPPGAIIRFNIIQSFIELTGSEIHDPQIP